MAGSRRGSVVLSDVDRYYECVESASTTLKYDSLSRESQQVVCVDCVHSLILIFTRSIYAFEVQLSSGINLELRHQSDCLGLRTNPNLTSSHTRLIVTPQNGPCGVSTSNLTSYEENRQIHQQTYSVCASCQPCSTPSLTPFP